MLVVFFFTYLQAQSPLAQKQQAIEILQGISSDDSFVQKNIERSIVFIEQSIEYKNISNFLDDFRISSVTGKTVFSKNKSAAATIMKMQASSRTPQEIKETLQQVLDLLVGSDKDLAKRSLEIAQQLVGVLVVDSKNLGKSLIELTKGEQETSASRAIRAFGRSWNFSQRSLSRLLKDLKIVDFNDSPDPFILGEEQNTLKVTLEIKQLKPNLSFLFKQVIKDSSDNIVRTITKDEVVFPYSLKVSIKSVWDGKDDQGNFLPLGEYKYFAFAQLTSDKNGKLAQLSFPVSGKITLTNSPQIIAIDPKVGVSDGGTPVTITGDNLLNVTNVFFGPNQASNIVIGSNNQISCTTPPKTSPEFTVDVVVENSFGKTDTLENAFTYNNFPSSSFTDITATNFPQTPGTAGNSFFDVDGDGDLDNVDAKANFQGNNVFINDGSGVFALAPNNANIPTNSEGHSSIPGDIDNDGDMDLVIGWFFSGGSKVFQNNNATFTDVSNASGVGNPRRIHGGALADVDQDGDLDLSFAVDGSNLLYINDGVGNFTEQGQSRGVNVQNFGISTIFADIDNDGDLDLLTTSVKTNSGTKILRNDGTGHFQDITALSGVSSSTTETCCFGDIDNDGDLDLYQGGIAVYANQGDGTFIDITAQTGIVPTNTSIRNCMWVDVNNDGHLDLWENGNLWLNAGNATFVDATENSGLENLGDQQNACFGDIDGDGDLDIKSSRFLIRNNTNNNNFLIIRPNAKLNSLSHNAKVSVYRQGQLGNDEELLGYREVIMSTVRLSGSTPYAHFGLPNDEVVDVRVVFLDGTVKDLENVQRGATITVLQNEE